MAEFTNLEKRLRSLGIPIHGGSAGLKAVQAGREADTVTRPDGVIVRVDFTDAATPQQRQQALAEAMAFDFTRTVEDDLGEITVPVKVLAALVVVASTPAAQVPQWCRDVLTAARNRIATVINGRTPSGSET